MDYRKKWFCGFAALLLCAGMLGGCGKKDQPENAGDSAAETVQESAKDAEESDAEESVSETTPEQIADARAALAAFLDGCVDRDISAVEAAADYRGMLSAYNGTDYTDAGWEEAVSEKMFGAFDSYEIGECSSDYQDLVDYNKSLKSFLKETEQEADPAADDEFNRCIAFLKKNFRSADGLCIFPVKLVSDGDAQADIMRLVLTDGSWKIDLCLGVMQRAASLRKYSENRLTDVNAAASALCETATASLSEMAADGIDISVLAGDYSFTASDFELVNQPDVMQTEEEVLTELRRRIKRDDPEIADCRSSAVRIADGVCTAAAAEKYYDTGSMFGSAPVQTDAEQAESIKDIRAALAAAG